MKLTAAFILALASGVAIALALQAAGIDQSAARTIGSIAAAIAAVLAWQNRRSLRLAGSPRRR